ncbi:hypothetical protein HRbin01_00481 [archaeon HR01]|nr:hypothetical protein HRbin01_00481 [archaeon HR01]
MPHLGEEFVIIDCCGSFPDCIAMRSGEEIGIEFEVLASNFFDHKHDEHHNLQKCKLIICWKNNIKHKTENRGGRCFLNINGHEIEVVSLDEKVENLKKMGYNLIHGGKKPGIDKGDEVKFFEQLKETVNGQKYELIYKLYEEFKENEDFAIWWGAGDKFYTMNFLVKRWDVTPVGIQANGLIYIGYAGNPAISPWELPKETQEELRKIFKHKEKAKWPTVPLKTPQDLEKIKRALNLIAEHSRRLHLIWHVK